MAFGDCKVYNDGSHYIAIPYRPSNKRRGKKPPDEVIEVVDTPCEEVSKEVKERSENTAETFENSDFEQEPEKDNLTASDAKCKPVKVKTVTRKEYFEELYEETKNLKKKERQRIITEKMLPYFKDERDADVYVQAQFERKQRNAICRRVRLVRKVNLADFNYFCTFTYDSAKHTEESFRRKLSGCFKMMCHRKNWRYAGVWERSPEKQRLHFHGLFEIPDGTMPGEVIKVMDYSPIKKKVQLTYQNTYFNERFGRSSFSAIDSKSVLGDAIAYLTKYIEKTGEKIVYSKNLPTYFISDIMDEDIVCTIGQADKKLLLFDDFTCWDEGCYIGTVSPEVIKQLKKAN